MQRRELRRKRRKKRKAYRLNFGIFALLAYHPVFCLTRAAPTKAKAGEQNSPLYKGRALLLHQTVLSKYVRYGNHSSVRCKVQKSCE